MLQLPAFAAIGGGHDGGVVTHRPAMTRAPEPHPIEHRIVRRGDLSPGLALIIRQQDVAPLADCDQTLAGFSKAEQGGAFGQLRQD